MTIENQGAIFSEPPKKSMATNCLYYTACKASGVTECSVCPEFRPRREK